MSPAKHSFASVTDGQTDDGQSDPYVSLCFAGDTKILRCNRIQNCHKNVWIFRTKDKILSNEWKLIYLIITNDIFKSGFDSPSSIHHSYLYTAVHVTSLYLT